MAKIIKIQCSGFGVSVNNVFNIYYTLIGNSTLNQAISLCGNPAISISQGQLLDGYVISAPDSTSYVYVYDMAGVCVGRYSSINVFPVSPTPTPTVTVSRTPSLTPSLTVTPTLTTTPTKTPSITISVTLTPTLTPTQTITPTITPTLTATPTI